MDGGDIHDVDHIEATTIDCTTIDTYNAEVDLLQMGGDIDMNGNDIDAVGDITATGLIITSGLAGSSAFGWSGSGAAQFTCSITALYSADTIIGNSTSDDLKIKAGVDFTGNTIHGSWTVPSSADGYIAISINGSQGYKIPYYS